MPPAMPDPSSRRLCFRAAPLLLFSGAAGLIYQVAWSKALGLIFGHTAYFLRWPPCSLFSWEGWPRERMARPVERAQGTAHRAVRLD